MKSIFKSAIKIAVMVTGVWTAKKYGIDKKIKNKIEQMKCNFFTLETESESSTFKEDADNLDYIDILEDER